MQVKSEKWRCMFVDPMPGDMLEDGAVVRAEVEETDEPMVCICVCG